MIISVFRWSIFGLSKGLSSHQGQNSKKPVPNGSDSVIQVNDSTRVTLRKMVTWLESRFSQNDSTRLESRSVTRDASQSHFYKISEFLMDKSTSFAHKEMSIFCFSDDQDWRKFSVLSVWSCYAVFYRSSVPNLHRGRPETAFTEGSAGRNILTDTLSWFNAVFAYRDRGGGPHTVTLSLFQMPVKWFNFFGFKSNQKLYCKI